MAERCVFETLMERSKSMIAVLKRVRKMLVPCLMSIGSVSYASQKPASPLLNAVSSDSVKVFDIQGNQLTDEVTVKIHRQDNFLTAVLQNNTDKPLQIKEVVLLDVQHGWPGESAFYGEGYTMLSQTAGTLAEMRDVGKYTDKRHYRLPEPAGLRTVYGMMRVTPPDAETTVLGFTSCRRFVGSFDVNQTNLRVVIDTEGLTLKPQEPWELEELAVFSGSDADIMLQQLAQRLAVHHPRLAWPRLPTGWCSWYCFGPGVTAQNIADNINQFRQHLPQIRYIQIDDGYQPWMGDWLEPKEAFGGNVQEVIAGIRQAGFEPAIWVAPFIASPQSKLFKEHPDWFIKDDQGEPLCSDKVTFGGWRLGPWYMLDGTHPEAQQYLEHVFRVMREQWGCTYFKLDANAWGAMPFGRRYDPSASSVQAYREGMAAVRRGAGSAFLLGCNHAIWPSIGEVHGSRSSSDIHRDWKQYTQVADENLSRNWQNQRLWWNDPDCLALARRDRLPLIEQMFHATSVYASGGMLLSGDDVTRYESWQWKILKKAAANPGIAATFENNEFKVGTIEQDGQKRAVFLNWSDQPERRRIPLDQPCRVIDFWNDKELGSFTDEFVIEEFPARSGGIYVLEPVAAR
jgi:alpha-galactosidase